MKNLISIQNLTYDIPHTGTILEKISLDVGPGELIGILGRNGSGKTTLLDLMMGFRTAAPGMIKVLDEDPNSRQRKNKHQVAYIAHDVNVKGSLSVREFLDFFAEFYPNYDKAEEQRLIEIFDIFPEDRLGALSTGQQKKAQFIAAAASRPQLLFVDEVTAVFDPKSRALFFHELKELQHKNGTTIVLATNIAEDLPDLASRVYFIQNKSVTVHSPQEILRLFKVKEAA